MNKSRDCEEFLNKMLKLARNGIIIDKKMVYGNLIRLGITKSGNVSDYFNYWQDKFANLSNISVFVADYWKYFCQFRNDNANRNNLPLKKKIKLYISMDLDHIKDGANKIFLFLAKENIAHISKISSNVRIDDIVIRIDNMDVASQIGMIIRNDKFLLSGLMKCNPFAFNDGIISYAWDGDLSYNSIVSSIIANYVNEIKDIKEYITYDDFLKYVDKIYNDTFVEGKNIDNFKLKMNVETGDYNEDDVLVNWAGVIKILLANLKHDSKIDDFYLNYKIVTSDEYYKEIVKALHKGDKRSKYYFPNVYDNSISQDLIDLWNKNYLFMIEKYHGLENALNYIQKFLETGDYSSFTRDYGIRASMIKKKITPQLLAKIIEIKKMNALKNASLDTLKKYDYSQLYIALQGLKMGKYNYFTNDFGNRDELKKNVFSYEVDKIVTDYLRKQGYLVKKDDDIFMIYIEEISREFSKNMHR